MESQDAAAKPVGRLEEGRSSVAALRTVKMRNAGFESQPGDLLLITTRFTGRGKKTWINRTRAAPPLRCNRLLSVRFICAVLKSARCAMAVGSISQRQMVAAVQSPQNSHATVAAVVVGLRQVSDNVCRMFRYNQCTNTSTGALQFKQTGIGLCVLTDNDGRNRVQPVGLNHKWTRTALRFTAWLSARL